MDTSPQDPDSRVGDFFSPVRSSLLSRIVDMDELDRDFNEMEAEILDDVRGHVQKSPASSGSLHKVEVLLFGVTEAQKAILRARFDTGKRDLSKLIKPIFGTPSSKGEETCHVSVTVIEDLPAHLQPTLSEGVDPSLNGKGFHVRTTVIPRPRKAPKADQCLLLVTQGEAEVDRLDITKEARVNIGRLPLIRGREPGSERRNHLAFLETTENRSVSRRHAHISYDPKLDRYLLYDDGSTRGTMVIREGTAFAVTKLGVPLVNGDQIRCGSGIVTFECD